MESQPMSPLSPTSPSSLYDFDDGDTLPKLFALVIGINKYVSSEFEDLTAAAGDADRFEDFLRDKLRVPEGQIMNLRDGAATRTAILEAFETLRVDPRIVKDEAAVVIYFAGHGARVDKPKDWKNWATASEQIEIMCPSDLGTILPDGTKVSGIPDRTLSVLLNHLSELKGDNITLILDCCSSGGLNRKAAAPLPGEGYIRRQIFNPPPISSGCDSGILAGETRGAGIAQGFSGKHHASHILLAACGREQFAYEHPMTGGGVFTGSLLKALTSSDVNDLTYTALMHGISMPTWQTPHCEGQHVNRRLFNKRASGADGSFILSQQKLRDGKICRVLHAGAAQGITVGSTFSVHTSNLISDAKHSNPSIGILVVTTVDTFTSELVFQPNTLPFETARRFYSKLIQRGQEVIKIGCDNGPWLETAFPPAVCSVLSVQIVDPEEATLRFTIVDGKVNFVRKDPMITPYIGSHFPHTVDVEQVDLVREVVRCFIHFNHHLTRAAEDFRNVRMSMRKLKTEFSSDFDQELTPFGPNLIEHELSTIVVDEHARLGMTIENQTDLSLYPYLFYFDPTDLIIIDWYTPPFGAGAGSLTSPVDAPLPPKSSLAVGYGDGGASPWQFLLREGEDKDLGFFKLFLTTKPADFSSIPQESPFDRGTSRHGQLAAAKLPAPDWWGSKLSTVVQVRHVDMIKDID